MPDLDFLITAPVFAGGSLAYPVELNASISIKAIAFIITPLTLRMVMDYIVTHLCFVAQVPGETGKRFSSLREVDNNVL